MGVYAKPDEFALCSRKRSTLAVARTDLVDYELRFSARIPPGGTPAVVVMGQVEPNSNASAPGPRLDGVAIPVRSPECYNSCKAWNRFTLLVNSGKDTVGLSVNGAAMEEIPAPAKGRRLGFVFDGDGEMCYRDIMLKEFTTSDTPSPTATQMLLQTLQMLLERLSAFTPSVKECARLGEGGILSVLWSGSVRDCGLCTKERAARQRWNLVCVVEWICERLRPVHQRTRGSAKVESRLCCGVDLRETAACAPKNARLGKGGISSVLWSGSVRDCGLCTKERAARQRWNLVCVRVGNVSNPSTYAPPNLWAVPGVLGRVHPPRLESVDTFDYWAERIERDPPRCRLLRVTCLSG